MMPTAVLNPTRYDAQYPFVCGQFQEALTGPHAPGYYNGWKRKVTDEDLPSWWEDSSGAPGVGNMPIYRGKLKERDMRNMDEFDR
eukprot:3389719-Karenia_brevis.AAC.1